MQRGRVEVVGDVSALGMRAARVGHDGRVGEGRDGGDVGVERVGQHQVRIVRHAIHQVHGIRGPGLREAAEHGQEWRQPGAAGQHQHRPHDIAQVETSARPDKAERDTRFGRGQKAGHGPARDVPHEEAGRCAGCAAEAVGPRMGGARHADADILARQKARRHAIERESDRAVRQALQCRQRRGMRAGLGLARRRPGQDLHNHVRLRPHLAGKRVALCRFLVRQRVLDVVAAAVGARLHPRFACAACAVAAVERDVDPGAIGGVCDGFGRAAGDEAGHAVFEV